MPLPFTNQRAKMVYLTQAGRKRAEEGGGDTDGLQILYRLVHDAPCTISELASMTNLKLERARAVTAGLANIGLVEIR